MRLISVVLMILLSLNNLHSLNNHENENLNVGTSIAIGVGAGSAIGFFIKSLKLHNSIAGPVGPQGPKGDAGIDAKESFICDREASLNFKFSVVTDKPAAFGTVFMPFVSAPNGHVFTSFPLSVGGQTQANLGFIEVENPLYGTYHVGVRLLTIGEGFDEMVVDLIVEVTASKNDKAITTILEQCEFLEFNASDYTQITAEYTYSNALL